MSDIESIKKRIKKLLALSKSPNENEAAVALEKANVLMEENLLTEGSCNSYTEGCTKGLKRFCLWRVTVADAVSWLYSTDWYSSSSGDYVFFGEEMDVFFSCQMYSYLVKSIDRITRLGVRKSAKTAYRTSFKVGVARNLSRRIKTLGEKCSWAPERAGKKKLVTAAMYKSVEILASKPKETSINTTACGKGFFAGETVSLNRQANGKSNLRLGVTGGVQ